MADVISGEITVATSEEAAYARTNLRIDNIIAHNNDTEGNSELVDIRTGTDGTVYASAGAAARKQLEKVIYRQNHSFNMLTTTWQNGKSLNHENEVVQANRCISDYIDISSKLLEVNVPDDQSVKYSMVFFDANQQCVREIPYSTTSGTYDGRYDGSYCKYCRIRIGMNDDSVPSYYSDLTNAVVLKWADSSVQEYRGNIAALGYISFAQCTQNGYYAFSQDDLSVISDKGIITAGGILKVENNAASNQRFQTVVDNNGVQYFRYGSNPFVKISDMSVCQQYRGNIQTLGYSTIRDCNQMGYYNCPTGYVANLTDAPSDLSSGFIVEVYQYASGGATYQTITDNNGDQWFRYNSEPFVKKISDMSVCQQYRGNIQTLGYSTIRACNQMGYYNCPTAYVANLTDAPGDLSSGFIVEVYPYASSGVIYQTITDNNGDQWFRYNSEPFVKKISDMSVCQQYRGNIQTLGYSTIRACNQIGYYNCPTAYVTNLTDAPSDLLSGFIVEVYPYGGGGVTYQTITDNNGDQWFRYSDRPFVRRNSNGYAKPVWYAIGDSITQGFYSYMNGDTPAISTTTSCWAKIAADKAGLSLTNYGVGGSGFVHAATVGDRLNARDHVGTIDFSGADMVTIAFGINDWKGSDTFGTFDDDITTGGTVYSNMRYVIEKILTDNPECKIFIITPINASKYGNQSGNWSLTHLINEKTLEDMYQLEKTVAEYYGIELIDMTHNSVFNRINCPSLMVDGVHPTLKGHQLMGAEMAKKIHFV